MEAAVAPVAAPAPEPPAAEEPAAAAAEEAQEEEHVATPRASAPEGAPTPAAEASQPATTTATDATAAQPAAPPAAAPTAPGPAAPAPPPGPRRVVVVTGGTGGIGSALVRKLLSRGDCDVVLSVNLSRPVESEEAVAALREELPAVNPPQLIALPLDLANQSSVEDFASRVEQLFGRVHWLFLCAGIGDVASSTFGSTPVLTADGHERTVAVNYLGHYTLVAKLLPALSAGAPARVVSVTCGRHRHAWRLDFSNWQLLNKGTWFKAGDAYNNSKVLNILFAYKLNRTYAVASGVTCNSVDPGIVPGTRLLRDQSETYQLAFEHIAAPWWALTRRVATADAAADALIAAAEHKKGGRFFEGLDADAKPAEQTRDEKLQNYIWDDTARLLGLEWPLPGL